MTRRILISALSSVVVAAGLTLGVAPTASAATCPSSSSPKISGAEAQWTLSCSGGKLKVYGWVEDISVFDGCANVRITPEKGEAKAAKACGSGEREQFSFEFPGAKKAEVRLSTDS
ncbi:hypothetical protein ABTX81_26085 [Kitasatospora sp. NPDC097605]|uniref:hypothetical protein n=1 Tax=Kitasatospora sp. NPDC097605 TaxID=3157226 RepID=UPI0033340295